MFLPRVLELYITFYAYTQTQTHTPTKHWAHLRLLFKMSPHSRNLYRISYFPERVLQRTVPTHVLNALISCCCTYCTCNTHTTHCNYPSLLHTLHLQHAATTVGCCIYYICNSCNTLKLPLAAAHPALAIFCKYVRQPHKLHSQHIATTAGCCTHCT